MIKAPNLQGSQKWNTYTKRQLEFILQDHARPDSKNSFSPDRIAWLKWRIEHWETLKLIGAVK